MQSAGKANCRRAHPCSTILSEMRTLITQSAQRSAPQRTSPVSPERRTIMTPLTSFATNPDGIRFETQEREEKVVLFLRQHTAVLIPSFLLIFVLVMTPPIFVPLIFQYLEFPVVIPVQYFVVGIAFWYVMTFGVTIMSFLRWYFNIYIVTERRIVDIDFLHLLYKEFSEARLEKIQDISFRSSGIVATLFDYGDVFVETAGETPNIDFHSVPRPARVIETIGKLLDKRRGRSI